MATRTLSLLLLVTGLSSALALGHGSCLERKDLTSYAKQVAQAARPPMQQSLKLPRRLVGEVFLNRGEINGLEGLALMDEPVTVVCFNSTLGALQLKLRAQNVTVTYDWVFEEEQSWGKATLAPQDIYIDLDIEKSLDAEPSLIAFYVSEPLDQLFNVTVQGGKEHSDAEQFREHIMVVTKMAFSRDARLALTYDIGPRIEDFLAISTFSIE